MSTVSANQRELLLKVYQGEARKTEGNLYLGELSVPNLPAGPAGLEVHVRFTYDLNGILEVEAMVPSTGQKYQTVLTQHVKGLSQKEISVATKRLQSLKFYPRDDLKNKELVLFCERVVGEISPYERESLETALDYFEHALSLNDAELFKLSLSGLLITLSSLNYSYDYPGWIADE